MLIVALLAVFLFGYYVGKSSYKKAGETVTLQPDTTVTGASFATLTDEEQPENPVLPVRFDTVYIDTVVYIVQTVDTAAIIADYVLKRNYYATLFDNTYGKLNLSLSTQYNRLGALDYDFTPLRNVTSGTVEPQRLWLPFVSTSYSLTGYWGVGAGFFYKRIGFEYQYQYEGITKTTGHLFGIKYSF
jgi:hypothetical protein